MWVKLLTVKQLEPKGVPTKYQPGDWVDVGAQLARMWLADGSAMIPPQLVTELVPEQCGVVVLGGGVTETLSETKLPVTESDRPILPYPKTLLWNHKVLLRPELLPVGFHLLETWQVACPLWDYDILASQVSGEAERERTKAVIRDLRVPLYETGLLYVKRCRETESLIRRWNEELADGGDEKMAFLRALYRTKPLILALPLTWHKPKASFED